MFCLVQYRVRPGEKCEFTTKSTKVTKRILAPAGLFVARQPSRFFSDGGPSRFPIPSRDARCEDIHSGRRPSDGSDHTKPACLGRFSSFRSFCVFVPFVAIPGKDPAAAFCKRLTHQSFYWCSFVSIRGSSFLFVDISFPFVSFFVALHGPFSSLLQPLGALGGFILSPLPTHGGYLSSLLQLLSGPS